MLILIVQQPQYSIQQKIKINISDIFDWQKELEKKKPGIMRSLNELNRKLNQFGEISQCC